MKMVLLNYYVGMDEEVKEILGRLEICTFTRVAEVEGRISCGEPREGSHVWPGANSTLFAVVEDSKADSLLQEVGRFNEGSPGEGIDAFVLGIDRAVWSGDPSGEAT
jgi:hypothetical protein